MKLKFRRSKTHVYLNSACAHGLHSRCRENCKFCYAPCSCKCHKETSNG